MTKWDSFDFDAWKDLYQTDPFAFESRRQATLMIEAARCGPAARETVAMLIAQKPSRDRQVRLEGSLNQLTRSMAVLAIHLNELARTLSQPASAPPPDRGNPGRDQDPRPSPATA